MAGAAGIIPTRGQIIATRAAVTTDNLTRSGWGNAGFEYWFPRPVKSEDDDQNPLIILGGGTERAEGYGMYETDDSVLDEEISRVLRKFLPAVFPGRFEEGKEPEMEWVRRFISLSFISC